MSTAEERSRAAAPESLQPEAHRAAGTLYDLADHFTCRPETGAVGLISIPGPVVEERLQATLRASSLEGVGIDAYWLRRADAMLVIEDVLGIPGASRRWLRRQSALVGLTVAHCDPANSEAVVTIASGIQQECLRSPRPDSLAIAWSTTRGDDMEFLGFARSMETVCAGLTGPQRQEVVVGRLDFDDAKTEASSTRNTSMWSR